MAGQLDQRVHEPEVPAVAIETDRRRVLLDPQVQSRVDCPRVSGAGLSPVREQSCLEEYPRGVRVVVPGGGEVSEHRAPLVVELVRLVLGVADLRHQMALQQIDGREPGAAVVHRLEDAVPAGSVRRRDRHHHDLVQHPVDEPGAVLAVYPLLEQAPELLSALPQVPDGQGLSGDGELFAVTQRLECGAAFVDVDPEPARPTVPGVAVHQVVQSRCRIGFVALLRDLVQVQQDQVQGREALLAVHEPARRPVMLDIYERPEEERLRRAAVVALESFPRGRRSGSARRPGTMRILAGSCRSGSSCQ